MPKWAVLQLRVLRTQQVRKVGAHILDYDLECRDHEDDEDGDTLLPTWPGASWEIVDRPKTQNPNPKP